MNSYIHSQIEITSKTVLPTDLMNSRQINARRDDTTFIVGKTEEVTHGWLYKMNPKWNAVQRLAYRRKELFTE